LTVLSNKPPGYYSYILRCWVEASPHQNGAAICRYSLEDPHTGERLTFPGLEALTEFLQARAAESGGCPTLTTGDSDGRRKAESSKRNSESR
jgi:hypothetical protein